MPYRSNQELPESVRGVLPQHAQDIYREAFNSAYDQYDEPHERRGADDRETVAHKVAWSAVKKKYRKTSDGQWVEK